MKLDILVQFIVPLTFLAIWALTSLLNRESQPLPPRPGRGPVPKGRGRARGLPTAGRSDATGPSRYASPAGSPAMSADRSATARRPLPPTQGRPGAARGGTSDEGIVILDSENRPSQSSSSFTPSSAASSRTRGPRRLPVARRPRSFVPGSPPQVVGAGRPSRLTGLVSQGLAPEPAPGDHAFIVPISPIGSPTAQISAGTTLDLPYATTTKSHPTLSSTDLRTMLASPGKIREIALLGELLQPPVALHHTSTTSLNAASASLVANRVASERS